MCEAAARGASRAGLGAHPTGRSVRWRAKCRRLREQMVTLLGMRPAAKSRRLRTACLVFWFLGPPGSLGEAPGPLCSRLPRTL